MNKSLITTALLSYQMIISPLTHGEVPHSFSAGTAAKAQQVNDNFNYLDSKIDNLSIDDLASGEAKCTDNPVNRKISYQAKTASLGSSIFIGSDEYKLAKLPFLEPVSNQLYHITLPIEARDKASDKYVYFSLYPFTSTAISCDNDKISGFTRNYNKNLGITVGSRLSVTNRGEASDISKYTEEASLNLSLNVGQSTLTLTYSYEITASQTQVNLHDYDFTDNINLNRPDFSSVFNQFDDLIDYIKIEKQ